MDQYDRQPSDQTDFPEAGPWECPPATNDSQSTTYPVDDVHQSLASFGVSEGGGVGPLRDRKKQL